MADTLSDDSATVASLEALVDTIKEWKDARQEEILKEVVYLKSLDVSITQLTEDAASSALDEAVATVEALSGYTVA
jgi:hypothetical protein